MIESFIGNQLPKKLIIEAQAQVGGFRSPSIIIFRDTANALYIIDRGLTGQVTLTQGEQTHRYVSYPSTKGEPISGPAVSP